MTRQRRRTYIIPVALLVALFGFAGYQKVTPKNEEAVTLPIQATASPAPAGQQPQVTQTSTGCNLDHVYHPQRLVVHGCQTVTGTVEAVKQEKDGDYHALLKLDPPYVSMLNQTNQTKQHGDLVVEDVCVYPVSQADAKASCQGYRSPFAIPLLGHHYSITGNYVTDTDHGWNELHRISSIVEQ